MFNHFIQRHKDILEVILAGTSGIGVFLTNIQFGLQILLAISSLGFIYYKWYCFYSDRKKNK